MGCRSSPTIPIRPRLGYEYTFISGNFLDPSGRYELPPRSLHAVEFELTVMRRFAVHASVRNLGDIRQTEVTPVAGPPVPYPVAISDFIGYPLPGRSFWISLSADFWPS